MIDNNAIQATAVTGLILAGGQARRMGGLDKGLVDLAGRPLIEWVIEGLQPQTGRLLINANRNREKYTAYGCPVIADRISGYCGPLAGIAAGLQACDTAYLVTCPCDSPLVPADLIARLYQALQENNAELAVAHNGERLQPVFALLARDLLASLETYLSNEGRKIDRWYEQHDMAVVDFSDRPEAFFNINTPEDIISLSSKIGDRTGTGTLS